MATSTAEDIIDKAWKKAGVDTPNTTQDSDGLDALNNLLTSWSIEGLVLPFVTRENFTLTIGDAEYTIGSGADFNTVRPLRIASAYLRDSDTDYPLVIRPLSEYNSIASKTTEGLPTKMYYLSEMADGKILFNLEPDKAYVLYLDSYKPLTEFALSSTTIASVSIPDEFKRLLIFNLAVDLCSDINSSLSVTQFSYMERIARELKSALKNYNADVRGVPQMVAPPEMFYPRGR